MLGWWAGRSSVYAVANAARWCITRATVQRDPAAAFTLMSGVPPVPALARLQPVGDRWPARPRPHPAGFVFSVPGPVAPHRFEALRRERPALPAVVEARCRSLVGPSGQDGEPGRDATGRITTRVSRSFGRRGTEPQVVPADSCSAWHRHSRTPPHRVLVAAIGGLPPSDGDGVVRTGVGGPGPGRRRGPPPGPGRGPPACAGSRTRES